MKTLEMEILFLAYPQEFKKEMQKRRTRPIIGLVTAVVFVVTQAGTPLPALAAGKEAFSEVQVSPQFELNLPPDLGTIQNLTTGTGPTLIHLQDAHGNFEAQKQIQAILHHLRNQYGIDLVLLEGASSELKPELIRFFPDRMSLTMKIAEDLTRKAIVKGPELFLLEAKGVKAYGIENRESYFQNGEAFKGVLKEREKTESFIRDMDMQIERLTGPYLHKDLRAFLKRLEDFEAKRLPILDWLNYLKGRAGTTLEIDLGDPAYQIDWPALVRIYKLGEFESKLDMKAFAKEREEFLSVIASEAKQSQGIASSPSAPRNDVYSQIESLLTSPVSRHQLPDPETGILFEKMTASLPKDFDYDAYPNVKIFIGHLILQSEVKGERLMEEMTRLTGQISQKLAKTDEEKKILGLLKDHRLLKRLFALELSPEDYSVITDRLNPSLRARQSSVAGEAIPEIASSPSAPRNDVLRPSNVIHRFLELNGSNRVKNIEFTHVGEIDSLFEKALEFYRGVKERDGWMLQNIEARLKETGADKAIVITGGFHAEPFTNFFSKKGYNYALIAPKITTTEGRDAYLRAVLQEVRPPLTVSTRMQVSSMEPIEARRFHPPVPDVAQSIAYGAGDEGVVSLQGPSLYVKLMQDPSRYDITFEASELFGGGYRVGVPVKRGTKVSQQAAEVYRPAGPVRVEPIDNGVAAAPVPRAEVRTREEEIKARLEQIDRQIEDATRDLQNTGIYHAPFPPYNQPGYFENLRRNAAERIAELERERSALYKERGKGSRAEVRANEESAIARRVKKTIADKIYGSVEDVQGDKNLRNDLAFDSLDEINLVGALETEFNLNISDEEWGKWKTVQNVIDSMVKLSRAEVRSSIDDYIKTFNLETLEDLMPRLGIYYKIPINDEDGSYRLGTTFSMRGEFLTVSFPISIPVKFNVFMTEEQIIVTFYRTDSEQLKNIGEKVFDRSSYGDVKKFDRVLGIINHSSRKADFSPPATVPFISLSSRAEVRSSEPFLTDKAAVIRRLKQNQKKWTEFKGKVSLYGGMGSTVHQNYVAVNYAPDLRLALFFNEKDEVSGIRLQVLREVRAWRVSFSEWESSDEPREWHSGRVTGVVLSPELRALRLSMENAPEKARLQGTANLAYEGSTDDDFLQWEIVASRSEVRSFREFSSEEIKEAGDISVAQFLSERGIDPTEFEIQLHEKKDQGYAIVPTSELEKIKAGKYELIEIVSPFQRYEGEGRAEVRAEKNLPEEKKSELGPNLPGVIPEAGQQEFALERLRKEQPGLTFEDNLSRAEVRTDFQVEKDEKSGRPVIIVAGKRYLVNSGEDIKEAVKSLEIDVSEQLPNSNLVRIQHQREYSVRSIPVSVNNVESIRRGIRHVLFLPDERPAQARPPQKGESPATVTGLPLAQKTPPVTSQIPVVYTPPVMEETARPISAQTGIAATPSTISGSRTEAQAILPVTLRLLEEKPPQVVQNVQIFTAQVQEIPAALAEAINVIQPFPVRGPIQVILARVPGVQQDFLLALVPIPTVPTLPVNQVPTPVLFNLPSGISPSLVSLLSLSPQAVIPKSIPLIVPVAVSGSPSGSSVSIPLGVLTQFPTAVSLLGSVGIEPLPSNTSALTQILAQSSQAGFPIRTIPELILFVVNNPEVVREAPTTIPVLTNLFTEFLRTTPRAELRRLEVTPETIDELRKIFPELQTETAERGQAPSLEPPAPQAEAPTAPTPIPVPSAEVPRVETPATPEVPVSPPTRPEIPRGEEPTTASAPTPDAVTPSTVSDKPVSKVAPTPIIGTIPVPTAAGTNPAALTLVQQFFIPLDIVRMKLDLRARIAPDYFSRLELRNLLIEYGGVSPTHPAIALAPAEVPVSWFQEVLETSGAVRVELTEKEGKGFIRDAFLGITAEQLVPIALDDYWRDQISQPRPLLNLIKILETINGETGNEKPLVTLIGDRGTVTTKLKDLLTNQNNGITNVEDRILAQSYATKIDKLIEIREPKEGETPQTALAQFAAENPDSGTLVKAAFKGLTGYVNFVADEKIAKNVDGVPFLMAKILEGTARTKGSKVQGARARAEELLRAALIRDLGIIVSITPHGRQAIIVIQSIDQFLDRLRAEMRIAIYA